MIEGLRVCEFAVDRFLLATVLPQNGSFLLISGCTRFPQSDLSRYAKRYRSIPPRGFNVRTCCCLTLSRTAIIELSIRAWRKCCTFYRATLRQIERHSRDRFQNFSAVSSLRVSPSRSHFARDKIGAKSPMSSLLSAQEDYPE